MRRLLSVVPVLLLLAAEFSPRLAGANDQATYRVVHGWPTMPTGFTPREVAGVGVDSHNHVFIFHRGKTRPVMMFDGATGALLGSWGDGLFGEGGAHGLAIDAQDNVWVTDIVHHMIYKFSHDGALIKTWGQKGVPGWDGNHFNQPTDLVVLPSGEFYVSDGYGNRRVARFDRDGRFLSDWGSEGSGPGQFATPHGIARDNAGRIYVADRTNADIRIFDADGKPVDTWKLPDGGRPWGLEIGPDGFLYVVDGGDLKTEPPDRGQVLKMDLKGNVLARFGGFGFYDGQFYWGHDLAVGKDGAIYVVDVNIGRRVQKFVPVK